MLQWQGFILFLSLVSKTFNMRLLWAELRTMFRELFSYFISWFEIAQFDAIRES